MNDDGARGWCVETGDGLLLNVNLTSEHATAIEARGNGWWTAREMTPEEAWRCHPYRTGLASWPAECLLDRYRDEPENRDVIRAEFERRWSGKELLPALDAIDAQAPGAASKPSRFDRISSATATSAGSCPRASTSS